MIYAYFALYALLSGVISASDALRFDAPTTMQQMGSSSLLFIGAGLIAFVQATYHPQMRWHIPFIGATLGVAAASLVFSVVRKQFVLLVMASLFLIPGAVAGYIVASYKKEQAQPAPTKQASTCTPF